MCIDPKYAIQEGWIINHYAVNVRNMAIGVTLDHITAYNFDRLYVSDSNITRRTLRVITPIPKRMSGELYWHLNKDWYPVISNIEVNLPNNVYATVITDPVLLDEGIVIPQKIFEPGYSGNLNFVLQSTIETCQITQGSVVGIIIFNKIGE